MEFWWIVRKTLLFPTRKVAVGCKYKRFDQPASIASLNNFASEEGMHRKFVANINASSYYKEAQFIPGILADRIGWFRRCGNLNRYIRHSI